MDRKHIKALTGVRGVAALWVFFHHIINQYPLNGSLPESVKNVADTGWLGVDLFFILSGFVISYVHQKDFEDGVTATSWKNFMILRFARVYPVHFFTTMALVVIYLSASVLFHYESKVEAFTFSKLVYSLTLTNGFGIPESRGWNIPSWSVSTEAFAYLVFPWLTYLVFSRKMSMLTCLISCIAILLCTTAIGWYLSDGEKYFSGWETNVIRILSEFSIGCLLFNIFKQNTKYALWWLGEVAFIAIIVMTWLQVPHQWDVLYIMALAVLVIALTEDKGLLARCLGRRIWIYLGEISYSVYLCHWLVFMVFNYLFQKLLSVDVGWHTALAVLVYVAVTWLVSHVTYYHLEVKARLYIKDRFLKKKAS
ncbi:hypothetical protein GZ77_22680 [Endozoicomonas montiporae]|uniref:Acyltransferase 3 domain-containing protein n=2 Tax=Endozoicomonas montiporae TaxID=1027273 RepID=A0A081N0E5_9GAMM|nr:acyltransferase [Endozoicomonas montiporae]AMO54374.1 acyltransferase [Endozoicomonas montiporae CL-33]KEQ11918.1 hypothetical protein GZ77_22680 [Endozoicomonas montiporae]